MKLNDLKAGHLVKLATGTLGIVIPNGDALLVITGTSEWSHDEDGPYIVSAGKKWTNLANFKEDFNHMLDDERGIVEVWGHPNVIVRAFEFSTESRDLLWERKEVKELTVDEVSELLGYEVKIKGGN